NFTLSRNERLKSRKAISQVFSEGQSVHAYPFRALYKRMEGGPVREEAIKFAFAVPKRSFRKAVDRNKLKRKMREVFRLNKHLLAEELAPTTQLNVVLMYTSREKEAYDDMLQAAITILLRLAKKNK
ncbi:UNVERIFIED_CONTAM: hypothetical protein GTU68_016228, partial [Idotea baltica]|nr:hypothetical protein [Idotea baltica]